MSENKNHEQNKMDAKYQYRDLILNKISPTMCTAKWLQTTVTLYNGMTHSCHHPSQHKVQVEAVKANPKALHNTPIKFYAREELLAGKQTKECNYCWNIENLEGDHISDRTYKSMSEWAQPHLQTVLDSGLGENINPTYFEVAFDSTCNFKCTYCSPDFSSKWMEEIQKHGVYQLSEMGLHDLNFMKQIGRFPIRHDEPNDYIDAFWKWWPDLYTSLHTFRITGGEPLLSKHTWRIFDYIIDNPRPELTLAINTNMGVPRKLIEKLVEYSKKLEGKIAQFIVYTSCESTGEQAEYIRYGMNYREFTDNCKYFLENTHPSVWLNFMIAANNLGVTTFRDFLAWIVSLREFHPSYKHQHRVRMMISYIRWPAFLNMRNLPKDIKARYGKELLDLVYANSRVNDLDNEATFFAEEVNQVERLVEFMNSRDDQMVKNMKDFALYHAQYDERRNVSFNDTFPELVPFIEECQSLLNDF